MDGFVERDDFSLKVFNTVNLGAGWGDRPGKLGKLVACVGEDLGSSG